MTVATTLIRLDSAVYWVIADATQGGQMPNQAPVVRRRVGLLVRRVSDSAGKVSLLRLVERSWSELF